MRVALVWALTVLLSGAGEPESPPLNVLADLRLEETRVARVFYRDLYYDAEVPMRTGEDTVFLRPELEQKWVEHRLRFDQELAGQVVVEVCPVRKNKYEELHLRPRTLEERKACSVYDPLKEPLP